MYLPPAFKMDDLADTHAAMRASHLANLVTATAQGLMASPLPLLFDDGEGPHGVLHGHVARANPQWQAPPLGEAMAISMGPDAYVSPSWYATKRDTGKVVPTWNYVTIHAFGPVEFFEDAGRLLALVTRLTKRHEAARPEPWAVTDAPAGFIASQLRGIVGLRMAVTRIDAKRKMSQNRGAEDRAGVIAGLAASPSASDRAVADLIPR